MPAKGLASMAKKAGKALRIAERYWEQAKESYEKLKSKPDDKWAYIMGIVKKRLGLESMDLAMQGIPLDYLDEDSVGDSEFSEEDKPILTIGICELFKVENGEKSDIVVLDKSGNGCINQSVLSILDRIDETVSPEVLRKRLPAVLHPFFVDIFLRIPTKKPYKHESKINEAKQLWGVCHHSKYGDTVYVVRCSNEPTEEDIIDQVLEGEYDSETDGITIDNVGDIITIQSRHSYAQD